jgi:hypothetical protein
MEDLLYCGVRVIALKPHFAPERGFFSNVANGDISEPK